MKHVRDMLATDIYTNLLSFLVLWLLNGIMACDISSESSLQVESQNPIIHLMDLLLRAKTCRLHVHCTCTCTALFFRS